MSFRTALVLTDMRKLSVTMNMSLDGVVQSPGGPDEDPTGGFRYGGWAAPYYDEQMLDAVRNAPPYELLLGRGTYEIFAAHWPYDEGPIADRLNGTRKHVASTTRTELEWDNSALIEGDVAAYVAELKQGEGPELQVHGSPGLVQTLLKHDLIDELRILIFPLVLGTGKRLFGEGTIPAAFTLTDSKVSKTGVTTQIYERAGEIEPGSFEFDEPTEAELERRKRLGDG
jgi:dihydrofolate reductase